jgi:hypothetical protein
MSPQPRAGAEIVGRAFRQGLAPTLSPIISGWPLFFRRFVERTKAWAHVAIHAWTPKAKPAGRNAEVLAVSLALHAFALAQDVFGADQALFMRTGPDKIIERIAACVLYQPCHGDVAENAA